MLTADQQRLAALHFDLARREARHWIGSKHDRDSAESEAMRAVCLAARCYSPEKGASFPTYARRCIRWKLGKAMRREGLRVESVSLDAMQPEGGPESWSASSIEPGVEDDTFSRLVVAGSLEAVQRAVHPEEFAILWERFALEWTLEEIAQRRGVSKQAVHIRLCRLVGRLRDLEGLRETVCG